MELNFKDISNDINERLSNCTHSAAPSDDEVIIAWLVCEIDRLHEVMLRPDLSVCTSTKKDPCPFFEGTDNNGELLCTLQIEDSLSNKGLFNICKGQQDKLDSLV